MSERLLSIVVPAFNEEAGIQNALRKLAATLDPLNYRYELVVVDDGSRDRTFERTVQMCEEGLPVRSIRLSRNFGKEAALLAGLQNAVGDAVITIDADLQHPPSLIPAMVDEWEKGAKIVHGAKKHRGKEHWWSTARANIVNKLITTLGGVDVRNSSDFKLLDRKAVDALASSLTERKRFYRGLVSWLGFSQTTVLFDVEERQFGQSGWSLRGLLALSLTALVSFTSAPLRVVSILGMLTFVLGIAVGTDAIISWYRGEAVSGFATIIITLLLIGSFIMISLGVIGEYIAKIYEEIKERPAYLVEQMHHAPRDAQPGAEVDAGNDRR